MISHKYKCIFVHIPKCGGTSIEDIIWPDARSVEDLWMGNVSKYRNKYQTGGMQHLFATHILQETGDEIFSKYFKFSFVRNPWDKAVSQFHYMAQRPDLQEYIGMSPDDSFKKYLELIQKKVHVQWDHQHRFILDDNGTLMVDFLGRFENFRADVRRLLGKLGIKAETLPHRMKTSHKAFHEYYDAESIQMVGDIYKKDITLFRYSFT